MSSTNQSKNKISPVAVAIQGKGVFPVLKRTLIIGGAYGFTPRRMERTLRLFVQALRPFGCGASFPITAVCLARNRATIARYTHENIDFAVHGYTHIDYSRLGPADQLDHLRRAQRIFAQAGIKAVGVRFPYLRRSSDPSVVGTAGFSYASNQPILWDTLDTNDLSSSARDSYAQAIQFYDPWYASRQSSLPRLVGQLVEIPVSLPDDEMLVDRLRGTSRGLVKRVWQSILHQAYRHGELFTMMLHPERAGICIDGLTAVLAEAQTLDPPVWLARLDEIAAWWRTRSQAQVRLTEGDGSRIHIDVTGPQGTTVLIRDVRTDAPCTAWTNGYRRVQATAFDVSAPIRPVIGLAQDTPLHLVSFLKQQGYVVEVSDEPERFSYYLDRNESTSSGERELITRIEGTKRPLLRLGRWPDGAWSALSVTGDIDALTLWDYAFRMLGS